MFETVKQSYQIKSPQDTGESNHQCAITVIANALEEYDKIDNVRVVGVVNGVKDNENIAVFVTASFTTDANGESTAAVAIQNVPDGIYAQLTSSFDTMVDAIGKSIE